MKKIYTNRFLKNIVALALFLFTSGMAKSQTYDLVVALDGTGNFRTLQAAIDSAPTNRTAPFRIFIKNGKYREKVTIPSNKPFIYLIGESVANVIISWDDFSGKPMPGGGTFGTSNSATVTVNATDFVAMNVTFENTTGDAPQALAINVNNDRCAFKNCRFLGGQDTVLTNRAGARQYFRNCYIDGVVDFIFGNAIAVFDSCIVYAKDRADNLSGSFITAANTPAGQTYGYVFRNCILPSNRGVTSYVLGRPWQNDGTTSPASNTKVVFLNSRMGQTINPAGWATWNANTVTSLITYAEYKTLKLDGTPYDVSKRVSWSSQLSDADAAKFYQDTTLFGTWNPCTVFGDSCRTPSVPIVISNFKARRGTSTVPTAFTWNATWGISGVKYEFLKSTDNKASFTKIYEITSVSDTAINFGTADTIPAPGRSFFYVVRATRAGLATHVSDTIEISSIPTLSVSSNSITGFLQGVGLPSKAQAYVISGVNLNANVVVTAPANYEISLNGTNWFGPSAPLSIAPSGTILNNTTIQVRLNATAVGSYSGNITNVSSGAVSVSVAVSGTTQADPLPVSNTLLFYSFAVNDVDSAALRSAGVAATRPTLSRFAVSDGTTVPTLPAYSALNGMAFGPSANGLWTTANGGPGGNLSRAHYVEYTVRADAGFRVKVDSFILNTSYYATQSNTRMALMYSLSGFVSDSSNVSGGGVGPDGQPLPASANGAFATPLSVTQDNTATVSNYRLAINGATGVTLNAGQTLSIRAYFSCGSTSTGRYAKVKDVNIKGLSTRLTSTQETTPSVWSVNPNPVQDFLTVKMTDNEEGVVKIYDVNGRLMLAQKINAPTDQVVLDVHALASGVYLLNCVKNSGAQSTIKFIKQP